MRGLIFLCLALVLSLLVVSIVAEETNLLSQLESMENEVEENADTLFFQALFDRIFRRKPQQAKPEIRKQIVPTTTNTTTSTNASVSAPVAATTTPKQVSQAKPQKRTFYQRLPKFARQAIDRLTKFKEALKKAKATKQQKKQAKKALDQQVSKNFVKAVAKNNKVSQKQAKKMINKAASKAQEHESVKKLEQLRNKIRELKKKNKALKKQNDKKEDTTKKTATADKIVENLKKGKLAFGVKLNRKQLGSLKGQKGVTEFYAKVRMLLKKREGMLKKAEKDASVAAIPKPLLKAVNLVHKFMATLRRFKKSKKTKEEKDLVSNLIKELRKADRHIIMNMPCCDRKLAKVFKRAKELGTKIDPSVSRVLLKLETKVKNIRDHVAKFEKQQASKGNGYHLVVRLNEMSKQKQKIQQTCARVQKDAQKVVAAVKELRPKLPKKHRKIAKKLIKRLNKLNRAAEKPVSKIDQLWQTTFGKIESSFNSFRAGLVGALKDLRKTAKQIRSQKNNKK